GANELAVDARERSDQVPVRPVMGQARVGPAAGVEDRQGVADLADRPVDNAARAAAFFGGHQSAACPTAARQASAKAAGVSKLLATVMIAAAWPAVSDRAADSLNAPARTGTISVSQSSPAISFSRAFSCWAVTPPRRSDAAALSPRISVSGFAAAFVSVGSADRWAQDGARTPRDRRRLAGRQRRRPPGPPAGRSWRGR